MKNTFLRQIQRMVARRKWLLLLIFLPLFLPVQTVKPYYKANAKIKLNIPGELQTHIKRMNWLLQQSDIISGESLLATALKKAKVPSFEIPKQATIIKDNLDVNAEGDGILDIELVSPEKQNLKTILNEIITAYFNIANDERKIEQDKLLKIQQEKLQAADDELKNTEPALNTAKIALDVFQANKMADDTKQMKDQVDELNKKLSQLRAVYTEEHPQVNEAMEQLKEKMRHLKDVEYKLAGEHKKETALSADYQKKKDIFDKLVDKNNSLKNSLSTFSMQEIGTITAMPRVVDIGLIEMKLMDAINKLLIGLSLLFLLCLIMERADKTVWNENEIKHDLGIKCLGSIAKSKMHTPPALLVDYPKDSPVLKSFEIIRSNIQFINLATPLKTILCCRVSNTNNLFAVNLSIAMAHIGGKVAFVNMDGSMEKYNRILASSKDENLKFESLSVAAKNTTIKNLSILDVKEFNATEREKANAFISLLKERFDVVIIDSPSVVDFMPGAVLAAITDGVIINATARKTRREFLQRNYKILNDVNARILGAVL